jgi:O-succinylbenzoate synthase
MHEFGVGRAANVAIASLPGFTIPGDVSGSDKYYAEDIVEPPILAHQGAIAVSNKPGLGVEPDEALLRARTTRQLWLGA